MAEYIKREELMKFPIRRNHYDQKHGDEHFINGIETVLEYAENLLAADVAPVVRCKDCKEWGDEAGVTVRTDGVRFARCKFHNLCVRGKMIGWCPTENDFCSYGERKEGADND